MSLIVYRKSSVLYISANNCVLLHYIKYVFKKLF